MKSTFLTLIFVALSPSLSARAIAPDTPDTLSPPKKKENLIKRIINRFNDYDTTYISPNYFNYSAMLQNTNSYQALRFSAQSPEGKSQTLRFAPSPSLKIGPYLSWGWISLGYTFDVSGANPAKKNTALNFSLYSSMLGCDLTYIHGGKGSFRLKSASGFGDIPPGRYRNYDMSGLESHTATISTYYVFNHRHFSYPAGFAQSTVQRKSSGSFILGLRLDWQNIAFDHTRLPRELLKAPGGADLLLPELHAGEINYQSYSVNYGYAYNWVFAPSFLLSASIMPALGLKTTHEEKKVFEKKITDRQNLNFDCISRLGIVWNNTRWFAGASLIHHFYDYRKTRLTLQNSIIYCNIYVGLNFNRKKQYRK